MRGLWRDIRYGARLLVKARWFTLAAVTPLALGIAATTTVFTLVNAVLLRGLPFNDSDRIMSVWTENERSQQRGISYLDYEDWRDQVSNLESFAAMLNANVNISDDEEAPERVFGAYVSANFFRMLGEQPFLGRDFTDDDDREGAPSVMILGHSVWENRYGADPGILGLTIRVNSLVSTVVGVMAPDMRFPFNTDVWIPRINLPPETRMSERIIRNFQGVGRLAPDASVEQARAELQALGRRLAEEYPESNRDFTPNLMGFNERMTGGQIRLLFLSLMGAVAFVLLIACANVANLLLARSADRAREMAVRVSLGATRWRVARQLLVENVLLAFLAGVAGLWLAVVGIRWFDASTQDIGKPSWMEFTMDGIVFAVMAAVCLATAILFGLAPALQVSKTDVNEVLKEGTRGGSGGVRARRLSGALIVGEVVLTLVLLSGAAFMMRSFLTMYSMDVGIETSQLVTMRLYLPLTQYPDPGPRAELYQNFEDRLAGIPRITGAIAGAPPLAGGPNLPLEVDGRVAEDGETLPRVTTVPVSDRYFDAVQIEALRGRLFSRSDGLPGSEAAIVNERFVEMHLPEGDPLGRFIRVQIGGPNPYRHYRDTVAHRRRSHPEHPSARSRGSRARSCGLPPPPRESGAGGDRDHPHADRSRHRDSPGSGGHSCS